MAENTYPARCTQEEFNAARLAGLVIYTEIDEQAVHKFAEIVRTQAYAKGYSDAIEFIATGDAA